MTFREKHLLITTVTTVLIWSAYFWRMGQAILSGSLMQPSFAGEMGVMFAAAVAVVVVIELVMTVIAHLTTSKAEREARDERETLAGLKGSHVALMSLLAMVFTLAGVAYIFGLADFVAPGNGKTLTTNANAMVVIANLLWAAFLISELIRASFTLVLLRRGH